MIAVFSFAAMPLLPQTSPAPKPSFDVVSIRPSAPNLGIRGGGPRGNRYSMSGATLRMLLQNAYQRPSTGGLVSQIQIIGGPSWIDSDRYDIQATVDCSGGVLSREQAQLMVQSMLEDRFQLRAHMETRELPIIDNWIEIGIGKGTGRRFGRRFGSKTNRELTRKEGQVTFSKWATGLSLEKSDLSLLVVSLVSLCFLDTSVSRRQGDTVPVRFVS